MRYIKILITSILLFATNLYAGSFPNYYNPRTFVGPTLQLNYGGWITNNSAYNVLGEIGVRDYRINLTGGYEFSDAQRLKLTAEYLAQEITYSFWTGNENRWMKQFAAGADYQFDISQYYPVIFDVNAYYSHAPNKTLSVYTGNVIVDGIHTPFLLNRHIAGSTAGGISPGFDWMIWEGGSIGLTLNYDDVHYDTRYIDSRKAVGFGGTIRAQQQITDVIQLRLAAGIRKPFNVYQANVDWNNLYWNGRWGLGIFGDYVAGKQGLESTYNAGVSVNYFADRMMCVSAPPANLKGEIDYKNEGPMSLVPTHQNFLNWVNDPAVYMPQVLAIVDQKLNLACRPLPVFIGIIPDTAVPVGTGEAIDAAAYFAGNNLSYSITVTPTPTQGDTIGISPTTGIVVFNNGGISSNTYSIFITATNRCGSVNSNVFIATFSGNMAKR